MARISFVDDKAISPDLRPLFAAFAESGFENQARVLAHSPAVFRHAYGMVLALRESGTLPRRLIEIVVVATSAANRCKYCVGHHAPVLEAEGLARETVERILEPEVPGLDRLEQAAAALDVQAFASGLEALGPPLGASYPRREDDVNELPDAPIMGAAR